MTLNELWESIKKAAKATWKFIKTYGPAIVTVSAVIGVFAAVIYSIYDRLVLLPKDKPRLTRYMLNGWYFGDFFNYFAFVAAYNSLTPDQQNALKAEYLIVEGADVLLQFKQIGEQKHEEKREAERLRMERDRTNNDYHRTQTDRERLRIEQEQLKIEREKLTRGQRGPNREGNPQANEPFNEWRREETRRAGGWRREQ